MSGRCLVRGCENRGRRGCRVDVAVRVVAAMRAVGTPCEVILDDRTGRRRCDPFREQAWWKI